MPWKVVKGNSDCPFEVVRSDTGAHVACHPTEGKAMDHVAALYANAPEDERADNTDNNKPSNNRFNPCAEIETREADVAAVNYNQRIVTLIAAPYEEPAMITIHGEQWQETFERGAWNTLRNVRPTRYRANRGHDKNRTVGKVVNLWPDRDEGLVADIKLSNTPLGNETLELANDDCLSASVGFGVMPEGELRDRSTRTRRITTAYLDHIAFVESPAYASATVLGVRSSEEQTTEQIKLMAGILELLRSQPIEQRQIPTPNLDQFTGDDVFRWASERLRGA